MERYHPGPTMLEGYPGKPSFVKVLLQQENGVGNVPLAIVTIRASQWRQSGFGTHRALDYYCSVHSSFSVAL